MADILAIGPAARTAEQTASLDDAVRAILDIDMDARTDEQTELMTARMQELLDTGEAWTPAQRSMVVDRIAELDARAAALEVLILSPMTPAKPCTRRALL